MIKRIVKMTFHPDKVNDFIIIFKTNHTKIASFEGCKHVELLQQDNLFFTFSIWESEGHLDAYRQSALFANVWGQTKVLFSEKPEAWTTQQLSF